MARYPALRPRLHESRSTASRIPAALRARVIRISYQDGLEGADRVEVTLANDGLRWLDHPLLQVDNRLSLSIGYAPDPLEDSLRRRDHRRQRSVPIERHADASRSSRTTSCSA